MKSNSSKNQSKSLFNFFNRKEVFLKQIKSFTSATNNTQKRGLKNKYEKDKKLSESKMCKYAGHSNGWPAFCIY